MTSRSLLLVGVGAALVAGAIAAWGPWSAGPAIPPVDASQPATVASTHPAVVPERAQQPAPQPADPRTPAPPPVAAPGSNLLDAFAGAERRIVGSMLAQPDVALVDAEVDRALSTDYPDTVRVRCLAAVPELHLRAGDLLDLKHDARAMMDEYGVRVVLANLAVGERRALVVHRQRSRNALWFASGPKPR